MEKDGHPARNGILALAISAVCLGIAGPAAAKEKFELRTITVEARFEEGPGGLTTPSGELCPDDGNFCGWTDFYRTIAGRAFYSFKGGVDEAGNVTYSGPEWFGTADEPATIKGCGSGTFTLDITKGKVHTSEFDPVTQTAPAENAWSLRANSGTGGLAGLVSGSGHMEWTAFPVEQVTGGVIGRGDVTGTITCRVSRKR